MSSQNKQNNVSPRKLRRQDAVKARKLARKQGFPPPAPSAPTAPAAVPNTAAGVEAPSPQEVTRKLLKAAIASFLPEVASAQGNPDPQDTLGIPEPGIPYPSLSAISPARLAANQSNAKKAHGPLTPETQAISAQNHTVHGLARHINGTFKLLGSEDAAAFEAFKQSLSDEHQPSTPTESILVNNMIESHWLAARALRLQDTCLHPETGEVTDTQKFNLYMRYQTTHARAFQKNLTELRKLRGEKRKAELGFEAQNVVNEAHEMKKQRHYWDVLRKDAEAYSQIVANTKAVIAANRENPGFQAQFEAELAKRGLQNNPNYVAARAA